MRSGFGFIIICLSHPNTLSVHILWYRNALFAGLERELRGRFEVTEVEDDDVRREVIDGRLGGLDAWAAAARTKDVVV